MDILTENHENQRTECSHYHEAEHNNPRIVMTAQFPDRCIGQCGTNPGKNTKQIVFAKGHSIRLCDQHNPGKTDIFSEM